MEKYIAVIMCEVKVQLVIPQKWYGTLDCNGYNRGINKSVKRSIFFSPFGDDVQPNFDLPISQQFQRDANACYSVYFLQACDTKAECIQYLNNRRVSHPAVYNDRRLREFIPDPRSMRPNLNPQTPTASPLINDEAARTVRQRRDEAAAEAESATAEDTGPSAENIAQNATDPAETDEIAQNAAGHSAMTIYIRQLVQQQLLRLIILRTVNLTPEVKSKRSYASKKKSKLNRAIGFWRQIN